MSEHSEKHPALGVYGLSFGYASGVGARAAIHEVSFELESGEFVALLGPNGSGKSTLMKLISGVQSFSRGCGEGIVRCAGADFLGLSAGARAKKINYIGAELLADFPLTAFEAVLMGRSVAGAGLFSPASDEDCAHVEKAMRLCGCWEFAQRDLRELSGGERQLVAVARALAQGAKILFIDEALSRMDLHHQARMGELLLGLCREQGYTVLLVSHDWNLATEWATRCILLKSGRILKQGAPSEVLTSESLEELYPHAPVWVAPHPTHGGPKIYFGKIPNSTQG